MTDKLYESLNLRKQAETLKNCIIVAIYQFLDFCCLRHQEMQ